MPNYKMQTEIAEKEYQILPKTKNTWNNGEEDAEIIRKTVLKHLINLI